MFTLMVSRALAGPNGVTPSDSSSVIVAV